MLAHTCRRERTACTAVFPWPFGPTVSSVVLCLSSQLCCETRGFSCLYSPPHFKNFECTGGHPYPGLMCFLKVPPQLLTHKVTATASPTGSSPMGSSPPWPYVRTSCEGLPRAGNMILCNWNSLDCHLSVISEDYLRVWLPRDSTSSLCHGGFSSSLMHLI